MVAWVICWLGIGDDWWVGMWRWIWSDGFDGWLFCMCSLFWGLVLMMVYLIVVGVIGVILVGIICC